MVDGKAGYFYQKLGTEKAIILTFMEKVILKLRRG